MQQAVEVERFVSHMGSKHGTFINFIHFKNLCDRYDKLEKEILDMKDEATKEQAITRHGEISQSELDYCPYCGVNDSLVFEDDGLTECIDCEEAFYVIKKIKKGGTLYVNNDK